MLNHIWNFLKYLERWEYYDSSSFWGVTLGIYFLAQSLFFGAPPPATGFDQPCQPQSRVMEVRGGGSKDRIQKIHPELRRRLEQHFPDWDERIAFQEKQTKFYRSAMLKKRESKRLGLIDDSRLYSVEELDALDYFNGEGCYAKFQDPHVAPNKFDTRKSFLLKMHDTNAREKFLKSFNRINN